MGHQAKITFFQKHAIYSWVKVFSIVPEFRVLRLAFHRKSAKAGFPQKVSLKILNLADFNSFYGLI